MNLAYIEFSEYPIPKKVAESTPPPLPLLYSQRQPNQSYTLDRMKLKFHSQELEDRAVKMLIKSKQPLEYFTNHRALLSHLEKSVPSKEIGIRPWTYYDLSFWRLKSPKRLAISPMREEDRYDREIGQRKYAP